jgi:hypothetical protein
VYFFVGLLDELDDRSSLDQLLRRVRKKQGDFINHTKLWEDICLTYAKMIRRAAHIKEGHEEGVFRPIGWEEFSTKTARLEGLTQLAAESQPLLELIRDSLELKKLNNNLMKVTMFEDLIADLYARVYELNMPQLIEQVNEENKEKMKVDHLLMAGDATTEASTPPSSAPAADTPAPRGRTKGIARRDIQKRADTIVNLKLGPRTAAKFAVAAELEQPSSTPRRPSATATSGPTSAPQKPGEQPSITDIAAVQPSDSNGIQDSDEGDDESKPKKPSEKPLFPNLNKNYSGSGQTEDDGAGSGDDGGDEAEGEGEGDEEEDGNDNEGEGEGEGEAATEAETGGEEGPDDDDGGDDEMQDDDGEDNEDTEDEGPADESAKATEEQSAAPPDDDSEKPEPMDITRA